MGVRPGRPHTYIRFREELAKGGKVCLYLRVYTHPNRSVWATYIDRVFGGTRLKMELSMHSPFCSNDLSICE